MRPKWLIGRHCRQVVRDLPFPAAAARTILPAGVSPDLPRTKIDTESLAVSLMSTILRRRKATWRAAAHGPGSILL